MIKRYLYIWIIILLSILSFSLVSAYQLGEYEVIEDGDIFGHTIVTWEGWNSTFVSYDFFCEYKVEENCSRELYENDINEEMEVNKVVYESASSVAPEDDVNSSGFLNWLKDIINSIYVIFSINDDRLKDLEAENDLLKSELCAKDNTYSWCK